MGLYFNGFVLNRIDFPPIEIFRWRRRLGSCYFPVGSCMPPVGLELAPICGFVLPLVLWLSRVLRRGW